MEVILKPHFLNRTHKRIKLLLGIALLVLPPILLQTCFMLMFVPSASMYPCLGVGDFLFGVRNPQTVKRGDILVFEAQDGQVMIKRLIGMPGETIQISTSGAVFIDGHRLEEPYVSSTSADSEQTFYVPEGKLLFLGDNRGASLDARYWEDPYIEMEHVLAIAKYKLIPKFTKLEENKNEYKHLPIHKGSGYEGDGSPRKTTAD